MLYMPHENTDFSPFELLLGCLQRGILSLYCDLITQNLQNENTDTLNDSYSYGLDLRERIISSCILAQQSLERSGEKYSLY